MFQSDPSYYATVDEAKRAIQRGERRSNIEQELRLIERTEAEAAIYHRRPIVLRWVHGPR